MSNSPPTCPYSACPSNRESAPFLWKRNGHYRRICDGRRVQRYFCRSCGRRFSRQSFRLDYRLHLPRLHLQLFGLFVAKVTHRQAARHLGVSRRVVEHRLRLMGRHAREMHRHFLDQSARRGGVNGVFQLDEMETFETDRRLQPVTVPVLMERKSYFVLHAETASMAARGRLSKEHRRKKEEREKHFGKRRSGSRKAVQRSLEVLHRVHSRRDWLRFESDRKTTYVSILKKVFGERLGSHKRISSRNRRSYSNPLFPINHTLAMMRDGVSRLVRRSWGASKMRQRLDLHLWIWIAYRNYIRGITVQATRVTPAMAIGVSRRQWCRQDFFRWRVPFFSMNRVH